jgi:hypothetical protein
LPGPGDESKDDLFVVRGRAGLMGGAGEPHGLKFPDVEPNGSTAAGPVNRVSDGVLAYRVRGGTDVTTAPPGRAPALIIFICVLVVLCLLGYGYRSGVPAVMLMVGAVFLLLAAYPVLRVIRLAMAQPPDVLSWKTDLVWATVAIVVIVGLPLYMNEASRPRSTRVQADVRVLASAVSMYAQTLGTLPGSLDDLTTVTTVGGVTAGGRLCGRSRRRLTGGRHTATSRARTAPLPSVRWATAPASSSVSNPLPLKGGPLARRAGLQP